MAEITYVVCQACGSRQEEAEKVGSADMTFYKKSNHKYRKMYNVIYSSKTVKRLSVDTWKEKLCLDCFKKLVAFTKGLKNV